MLYIIWTFFNAVVFCLLLWMAYKAAGMVREKLGWAASLLLIVGLLSFMQAPEEKEEKNVLFLQPAHIYNKNPNQVHHSTVLEKYPLFTLHLDVTCNVMPGGKSLQPAKVMADQYGLVTAHNWTLQDASVYYNIAKQQLEYKVYGTINWKLLGIPFYAQSKSFAGSLAVQ